MNLRTEQVLKFQALTYKLQAQFDTDKIDSAVVTLGEIAAQIEEYRAKLKDLRIP